MVSVALIWIYMIVTCYITGFAALRLLILGQGYQVQKESSFLYAGIAVMTVYAQFFSLLYKVGFLANAVLLLVCAFLVFLFRKELIERLHTLRLTISPVRAGAVILLFLLFTYGTSTGILHYDTGLYHAQSIRWIEEYGILPGLGNLHSRLAYNSASFCLSALYSFAFLGGQSYHCCAGFLAFLLALTCMEGVTRTRVKKPQLSDFVRILGVYYLLMIFDEMVSPASDYFMVLLSFYILIRWLDFVEKKEKSSVPYGLLCVLCVLVMTIKLSGAMLLLLTIKPAVELFRKREGKQTAIFLGAGFVTALPFFIRNVILSGWLVYPFTFVDLFHADYQIPKGMAEYDAKEIQVYGRGFSDVARYDEPITKWLPDWAKTLNSVNKVFLLLAMLGLLLFLGYAVYALIRRKKDMLDELFLMGTTGVCFLFWLASAPLIRYGCIYLWVFPALAWGFLYLKISPGLDRYRLFFILLALAGAYKAGTFAAEMVNGADGKHLVHQKDYENFETVPYELHGYTFYYPKEGDRTGYKDFPASPIKAEDIFRGASIEEGFRDVVH